MGFDFGLRRIGVAVGSEISGHAQALASVANSEHLPDWRKLGNLVSEWQPALLVVGLPRTLAGDETPMSEATRAFADALRERFKLPVEFVDEQLSSSAARDQLRAARRSGQRSRRVRKADIDPVAAKLILETWLNERAAGNLLDEKP